MCLHCHTDLLACQILSALGVSDINPQMPQIEQIGEKTREIPAYTKGKPGNLVFPPCQFQILG